MPNPDLNVDPRAPDIAADILSGMAIRAVAKKYGVQRTTIDRYIHGKLALAIHDSELRSRLDSAVGIRAKLEGHLARIEKLFDACDEFLSDPDDPSKYYLGPRASEVRVVYYTRDDNGKRVRESALLDDLLARAGERIEVDSTQFDSMDPRKVVLATAQTATKQLEVLARLIEGAAKIEDGAPITSSEAWVQVQQVIVNIVKDDPSLMALIERLDGHMGSLINAG